MAKQVAKAKSEAPDAVKAKGAKAMPEDEKSTALTMPKASALSNVAVRVLELWTSAEEADLVIEALENEIREREAGANQHRHEGLQLITSAILKAIHAGADMPLEYAYNGSKSEMGRLLDQVRLVTGMSYIGQNKSGQPAVKLTPEADKFLNEQPGDDETTLKRKNSLRINTSNRLKMCCRAAATIVSDPKTKVEVDKAQHTLRLTGPMMKEHFGAASVTLNEKQNVQPIDKKGQAIGDPVKLKAKPSWQALANIGAAARGKVVARKGSHTVHIDPMKHLVSLANDTAKAINTAVEVSKGELPDDVVTALESLENAIKQAIE